MKEILNSARVRFPAVSENESFARVVTAGFLMHLGVTPETLADLKTVVSGSFQNGIGDDLHQVVSLANDGGANASRNSSDHATHNWITPCFLKQN